ncbi:MAG: hypothetical protein M1401_10465 [Chloroflexi bacterium]|nr:hypothetical protein [Chloroflexota bacterium]
MPPAGTGDAGQLLQHRRAMLAAVILVDNVVTSPGRSNPDCGRLRRVIARRRLA